MAGIFEKQMKRYCATAFLIGDAYYYNKFLIGQ